MPAGADVTVPAPVPAFVTARANVVVPMVLNVAVTARACVIDTAHVPVPEHAPPQPPKVEPLAAAALSVTDVPLL